MKINLWYNFFITYISVYADHYDLKMLCHLILSLLADKCPSAVLAGMLIGFQNHCLKSEKKNREFFFFLMRLHFIMMFFLSTGFACGTPAKNNKFQAKARCSEARA